MKRKIFVCAISILLLLSACENAIKESAGKESNETQDIAGRISTESGSENVESESGSLPLERSTVEIAAKSTAKPSKTAKTPAKRSNTLADYDGWWHHISDSKFSIGDVIYVDSKAGTYFTADKYGNADETLKASYNAKDGKLHLEPDRYSMADVYVLYFGEKDNLDTLYYYDYVYDDGEIPAYVRGKAPVTPKVSMDGLPGKWYRDGVTKGDKVHVIELLKNGSYRYLNNAGKIEEKGNFKLSLRVSTFYRGDDYDYISIQLGKSNGHVANDRVLMDINYYYENEKSARGFSYTNYIYLHESAIGNQKGKDAMQRRQICSLSWESSDGKNSLRFSRDGQVHNYIAKEYGWMPEKAGTWTYEKGVLTIKWHSEFNRNELTKLASVKKESCTVSDVTKGFTIPSLGRIRIEKVAE